MSGPSGPFVVSIDFCFARKAEVIPHRGPVGPVCLGSQLYANNTQALTPLVVPVG